VELRGGAFGNNNGLCETLEDCLFTPNIGSYQGEGDLNELDLIDNGVIEDVLLFDHEVLAVP
jgi:hypothetical protein